MPSSDTYKVFKDAVQRNDIEVATALLIDLAKFSNEQSQTEAVSLKNEYRLAPEVAEVKREIIGDMLALAEKITSSDKQPLEEDDFTLLASRWRERVKEKDVIFTCKNVCKKYPNSEFTLQHIDLTIKAGDVYGVVGENGNGKTTLLKIIAGESRIKEGTVSYGVLQEKASELNWFNLKKNIAYLPQELDKLEGSVKKSIQYEAAIHGIVGTQNDREVEYIIQRLGLGAYKKAQWQDLSGGYKLRFALAQTLVWKPKLVVLDEPLANLDINTQVRVLNDLRSLAKSIKNPIAVVLSSQNIEEVEAASDHMIVLKNGEIVYNNSVADIGNGRDSNIFEFKTDSNWQELEEKLVGFIFEKLEYNGFSFFISVPLHVMKEHFLKHCIDKEISLNYFQDISQSTKKLIIVNSFS